MGCKKKKLWQERMTEKRTDGGEEEQERENSAGKLGMHSLKSAM